MPKYPLFVCMLFVFGASPSFGATRVVNVLGDTVASGCTLQCNLRQAITVAQSGDTIIFDPNVFRLSETIALNHGEIVVNKSLTISGPGADRLTIARSSSSFFRIFRFTAAVTMTGLTISSGWAMNDAVNGCGGAIYNSSILTLDHVEIRGNTAVSGGGLCNAGTSVITNSTVSENASTVPNFRGEGGGINNLGTLTITNSTIAFNIALQTGQFGSQGGGIFQEGSFTTTLRNVTIAYNSAQNDGGGLCCTGTFNIGNSILANNTSTSGPDFFGTVNSLGYNLIKNYAGTILGDSTGNILGTDPMLVPNGLNRNGSDVRTIAMLPTSLAIDAGNSGSVGIATDQRGRPRPYDDPNSPNPVGSDGSDLGAFEVQPTASRISGRLITATGSPLNSGILTLTNSVSGQIRIATVNSFGFFSFTNIPTGQQYQLLVRHKRYSFVPLGMSVQSEFDDVNLTATPWP
ncbi:MAG TPA: carboxypeptidase-like regulatory domain-containing protein [Pyrinomonadaceae bacterium]|nr:carboxypeptidase-like regulatory domain-containing protein [Pyrinomonadaceae bacterium]